MYLWAYVLMGFHCAVGFGSTGGLTHGASIVGTFLWNVSKISRDVGTHGSCVRQIANQLQFRQKHISTKARKQNQSSGLTITFSCQAAVNL